MYGAFYNKFWGLRWKKGFGHFFFLFCLIVLHKKFDLIYLYKKQLINFFKLRDQLQIHEINCTGNTC